uniref:DUF6344 domain-containing protein n=1 Tax=Streptomyces sp. SS7 TaxID=3108485 RepID=UPI004040119F
MTVNQVMKLWTAIVTAFLALCTALGFVASTAATATAQTGPTHTDAEKTGGAESPRAESAGGSSPGGSRPAAGESSRADGLRATSPAASSPRGRSAAGEVPSTKRVAGRGVGSVSPVGERPRGPVTTSPAVPTWDWFQTRSLPPTMKQRILAEAHGKSPSCRHSSLDDADAAEQDADCDRDRDRDDDLAEAAEPSIPLQR